MLKDKNYGYLPFNYIYFAEIKVTGLKKREYAAYIQYQLLLLDSVLRCHVDFNTKICRILFLNEKDIENVFRKNKLKYKIVNKIKMKYTDVIEATFNKRLE